MNEKLYTPLEAAEILKIKKNTVYEMIKRGTLKATKMGKQLRITESDLNHLITPGNNRTEDYDYVKSPSTDYSGGRTEDIIVCGQDIVLDMLCSSAHTLCRSARFIRSYEGSYNGLLSLYKDEVSVASAHIWDYKTNSYNLPYISSLIPGEKVHVYHVLNRPIGFYIAKGNPKNICSIEDFSREDIHIANREKGSGIRILTDSLLLSHNITPSLVKGYNKAVSSHLAAAAIVAKGGADCAIGSKGTALQMPSIDFLFLRDEQYDIVIKEADINRPEINTLIKVLNSREFADEINAIGLYDITDMGKRLL
ncbi:substrate-binding domain-containing protein [Anaerocolumna xylanovorans]|uniref:Putative molybdopterin biosynthesis protein n=1 Tax=Anaerocolumna xylanovorans DSM 12503 TaxID=1121345 RepID=A0A1M7YHR9_9FIRM|nr:helix-turn-helix transcriptional regulator [Anaerocolumna xylanovorans]SHO52172.1 putative molybdopterin biosynthesis protein [Anaerocolumna xylanovorans DSM 12503]